MKITYEFVTGEVSEVEVDERLGGMLLDLNRQQDNNDQKETRRHFSLNGMDYEGELFASAEDAQDEAVTKGKKWAGFKLVEGRSNRKSAPPSTGATLYSLPCFRSVRYYL